ncbi:MAG: hypothetical protein WAK97_10190 [Pseudolabrys sp.]
MTVVRSDWSGANTLNPRPEAYAPLDRRPPAQPYDLRTALPLTQTDAGQSNDRFAGSLDALIRRIAGASMDEIDSVIHELERVRNMLCNEGERVSREIAGYAGLSRASMAAMQAISDSIRKWKDTNTSG